jgi:cytochrome c oxidase assembly protein subunit 15
MDTPRRLTPDQSPPVRSGLYRPSVHVLAWLAVAAAVPLLVSGADVTTRRVGMAVPDWPTTFGENMFTYDMSASPLGVLIEHRHRLFGASLGILSIILAVWFLLRAPSLWMKLFAVATQLAVDAQGILGGTRVLRNSTFFAAIHGISGQIVFAMLVALVVLTSRSWHEPGPRRMGLGALRARLIAAPTLVLLQSTLGARLRHFGLGLEWHALMAVLVLGYVSWLAFTILSRPAGLPGTRRPAVLAAVSVVAQVALGIAAWWLLRPFDGIARPVSEIQALVRNGHLLNGALLLGATTALALRAIHHLAPCGRLQPTTGAVPSGLKLEAVS